jgi:hypothetical protein
MHFADDEKPPAEGALSDTRARPNNQSVRAPPGAQPLMHVMCTFRCNRPAACAHAPVRVGMCSVAVRL